MRGRRLILLLVCLILITGTSWARSHSVADGLSIWYTSQRTFHAGLHSERGTLRLIGDMRPGRAPWRSGLHHNSWLPDPKWGLQPARSSIDMPYWLIMTALATLLAGRILQLYLRRRRHAGLCASCGYDLRASRERCPECGTPIPASAAGAGS